MGNILIADAGATKIHWALLNPESSAVSHAITDGVNPMQQTSADISMIFKQVNFPQGLPEQFEAIYYYGAGCATDEMCGKIKNVLSNKFHSRCIEVETDMLAAARSLFGFSEGIACILGTGSNVAVYNGRKIILNIPPLGFILGDDGSGAALGKRFISSLFKGLLPSEIKESFFSEFNLTLAEVLHRVYKEPMPAAFLATFAPFILRNSNNPEIRELITDEFSLFFHRNVKPALKYGRIPVSMVGSVAFHFQDLLLETAADLDIRIRKIVKDPMEGLILYHRELCETRRS